MPVAGSTDRDMPLRELRFRAARFATGGIRLLDLLTGLEYAQQQGATGDEIVEAVAARGADATRSHDPSAGVMVFDQH